jgi:hypothetical protein
MDHLRFRRHTTITTITTTKVNKGEIMSAFKISKTDMERIRRDVHVNIMQVRLDCKFAPKEDTAIAQLENKIMQDIHKILTREKL